MAILDRLRRQQTASEAVPITATAAEVTAAEQVSLAERTVELGSSGTINYQGFLQSEEYNRELLPPESFKMYDRMAVSDPVVRATMLHMATPIKAAEWRIKPASDSDQDLEIAAFISNNLFEWMQTPWAESMDDQLKYLRWGVAVLEEVWEHRTVGWEYRRPGEGEPVQVAPRDVYTLRKMAPRLPRTIWRWINDPDSGDLAIIQTRAWKQSGEFLQGQYVVTDIPADKCLVLSNEKVGDDWWGVSMLRGAYKPWWILEAMQRITAIGYERFYVGTPMARMNQNATDSQRNAMLRNLTQIRSGERASIVYSASDGLDCEEEGKASGTDARAIWILQPDKAPPDSVPWIRQLESNIFTSIMARFMDLGQRETGARATAEIQDDPFYLGLVAVANHVAETWNRGPIKRLVDANFPNVDKYPCLEAARIAPEDIPIIASAAAAYAGVGFLTPDFATEQWIRTQLNMPDKVISEEDVEQGVATKGEQAKPYPSILGLQQQANNDAAKAATAAAAGGADGPKTGASFVRPPVQSRASKGTSDGGGGTALDADPVADGPHQLHFHLGDDGPHAGGFTPRRDVHPDEAHVNFQEISDRVDAARNAFPYLIAGAYSAVQDRLSRELGESVDARSASGTKAKDLGPLSNAIFDALVGLAGYGHHSVEREMVLHQNAGVHLADPIHDQLLKSGNTEHLRRTSESAAAAMGAAVEQVGKQEALAQIRRHGAVVDQGRLAHAVQAEGTRQARLHSMLLSTEALNIGRATAAENHADDIKRVRYTSLMDRASCGPCEGADGTVTTLNSDLYKQLDPPNPACQGGPRCRCIWVYLT